MSTKVGNYERDEREPHPPPVISSPPLSPEQGETIKPSIRKTGYVLISHVVLCKRPINNYNKFIRWLEVKTVLVRKNRKVAMASKRKWKKYWGKANEFSAQENSMSRD